MVGHDGNRVVEPHDLPHTLDGLGRRITHALHTTAEDGRLRKGRDLHPRRPNVDAVDGRSVDLARCVQALGRGADELEILRSLERHLLRNGQLCRIAGKSAIFDPARARLVNDLAVLRVTRGRIHLPALCRRSYQHDSGSCAGLAQWLPRRAHRVRVASGLQPAQQGVTVELLVGRSMFQAHLTQGHLQLFRDEHGYGRVGALAHLHIRHDQRHQPVGADSNEGVGRKAA